MASGGIDRSSAKSSVAVLSSVREQLECPVCFNTMYPPIHQCFNGHLLCSDCKVKVHSKCPTCRHQLDDTRCLALEKVAASIELPCKYEKFQCQGVIPYCKKLEHESQCSFRPYNCPVPNSKCSFLGDIPSLVSHLKDYHKATMDNLATFNYFFEIYGLIRNATWEPVKNATWEPSVLSCFGQYFILHAEMFQLGVTPLCILFLLLIGNDEEAKNYSYSLEFEANGRKTIWQGVPRSIRDNHSEVRNNLHGLIISQKFFSCEESGDGKKLKLWVGGKIWKDGEN